MILFKKRFFAFPKIIERAVVKARQLRKCNFHNVLFFDFLSFGPDSCRKKNTNTENFALFNSELIVGSPHTLYQSWQVPLLVLFHMPGTRNCLNWIALFSLQKKSVILSVYYFFIILISDGPLQGRVFHGNELIVKLGLTGWKPLFIHVTRVLRSGGKT